MSTSTPLMHGKKHYILLGKLLAKNRPEIAAELLSAHNIAETDYTKIPAFLHSFCILKGFDPKDSTKVAIDHRREFLCAMLHLYNPQVFSQPIDGITLKVGFVRQVSNVILQHESNTSRMIREVLMLERVYDDFRNDVDTSLQYLKGKGGANGQS